MGRCGCGGALGGLTLLGVLLAAVGGLSGCKGDGPAPSSSVTAKTSQPATLPAGTWPKPDELRPGEMKEHVSRWMVVRSGGRRIGHMHYTVFEFVETKAVRTRLEYFLFPDERGLHGYRYWNSYSSSVTVKGQPLAEWLTGQWGGQGYNYRLQAGAEHATVKRNKYGESLFPRVIRVPRDFLLNGERLAKARTCLSERGRTFACRRFAWDVGTDELLTDSMAAFPPYVYVYEGPETITLAEGRKISAHRFREQHNLDPKRVEYLWVDDEGQPVRRSVPYANDFELLLSTEQTAKDGQEMTWPQAQEFYGEKVALTTRPAGGDL